MNPANTLLKPTKTARDYKRKIKQARQTLSIINTSFHQEMMPETDELNRYTEHYQMYREHAGFLRDSSTGSHSEISHWMALAEVARLGIERVQREITEIERFYQAYKVGQYENISKWERLGKKVAKKSLNSIA